MASLLNVTETFYIKKIDTSLHIFNSERIKCYYYTSFPYLTESERTKSNK